MAVSWLKKRKALQEREATEFAGQVSFPESLASPRTEENNVAMYQVVWLQANGKPAGNSWTSRRKAEEVRNRKIAEGTFIRTCTKYCAGFIF